MRFRIVEDRGKDVRICWRTRANQPNRNLAYNGIAQVDDRVKGGRKELVKKPLMNVKYRVCRRRTNMDERICFQLRMRFE